jgi:CPA1 family monovalent cation:H+ antiporter
MVQVVFSILAVSVVLALASLLLPISARLRAPHTVLLAALGMALGFLVVLIADPQRFGLLGDVMVGLRELGFTAEAFLFIFLPPLLFTAGLNIDVRRLVDELAAVILMAVVAVLVCIVVVGVALHWASGVSAVACFLLGAIISTTDPAAVIGIFRDIGAPRRLSILVEGESLLNDAAAIAVFALLVDIVTGKTAEMDNVEALFTFLREFIGGLAIGFVLGRVACWLLTLLGGSHVGHVTITVCLAYIAFILGDHYLHVSGVVAVVASALTVAAYGPTRVSPGAWRSLLKAWHQLEFWANSLIFVLAAMLGAQVLRDLQWHDLALLAVVIVAALVARGLVLFGLLPGLSALRLVAPVDNRYKAVIVWGGLRGAVTVVLALVAIGTPGMPEAVRHLIGVLATLFVLFTLFVNGTTLRLLMRVFGLNRLSATEVALRDRAMVLSRGRIADQVQVVARTYGLESALPKILPGLSDGGGEEGAAKIGVEEATQVGLLTLAARERELYLRHFEQRVVSRRMVARLVAAAERLADMVKSRGAAGYAEGTKRFAERSLALRFALLLNRRAGIERPLSQQLADHCEMLLTGQLVLGELAHFNRLQLYPLLGSAVAAILGDMLDKRRESIDGGLAALSLQYGGYADKMRVQYLTRAALRFEGAEYDRQVNEGIISHEVYDDLQRQLAQRRAVASQRPPLDLGMELRDMIGRVPMFRDLDNAAAALLGRLLRPVMALPGEEILTKGDRHGREMYFIASGAVEVLVGVGAVRLEAGDFFGELALLADRPRTADVVAVGYCHLLELSRSDLRRIMRANPGLRAEIEKVAAERLSVHDTKPD